MLMQVLAELSIEIVDGEKRIIPRSSGAGRDSLMEDASLIHKNPNADRRAQGEGILGLFVGPKREGRVSEIGKDAERFVGDTGEGLPQCLGLWSETYIELGTAAFLVLSHATLAAECGVIYGVDML